MLAKYAMGGANVLDIHTAVLLVLMVQVMRASYDPLTDALWEYAEQMASGLQQGMIGTKDAFFAPKFIGNVVRAMSFSVLDILNPVKATIQALTVWTLSLAMLLLSVISYVSIMWGFWGFTLAKLIGLMFVPTLLLKPISFMFDGWLRFFLGWIVYYVIARINVVMVACAIALYLGIGIPFTAGAQQTIELPQFSSIFEMMGLITFMFIGILALFSSGKFAASIVAGAGGGGMGSSILAASRAAAKITSAII
ncbi:hypothetical protein [Pseudoduganella sp. UC29_106]|uniref:hypothetical protein n=1 Tax=Pseudoduganella sp. UC29_106 TaxID=3374553 RepID=UPI003756E870